MKSIVPEIVFLDAETIGEVSEMEVLRSVGNLTVYQSTPAGLRIERISGKEIVITNKVIIDRAVMDACPSLRLICIAATGMNNVDLSYAAIKGIKVNNVAGYSTESVVQHTMAMMLALTNQIEYYSNYVRSGQYAHSKIFTHYGPSFFELSGKTFGIIGLGTIGRRVAGVAAALGMNVLYYSTTGKNSDKEFKRASLDNLLAESDIVSIHCPLNEDTRNLIDDSHFSMMKNTAILINTGRGGVVNEQALAKAIDNKVIAGAALDVMEKEPPAADNPLLKVKYPERLIITPHIAWATIEARNRLVKGLVDNIRAYLNSV